MKLLILTQKIDINDDLLGFFHSWVAELARHCEKIIVIALGVGQYRLPENVKVFSLGKEKNSILSFPPASPKLQRGERKRESRIIDSGSGAGMTNNIFIKIKYIINFYKYIWSKRKNYDTVFVHMNQEYVILGGFLWRLLGKKVTLWRNHQVGGFWVRIAVWLSDVVFCTSQFAFVARYKKTRLMPAGIDTDFFWSDKKIQPIKKSILYLGRLSPIKNIHVLLEAANLLDKENVDFILNIVGEAGEKDGRYFEKLKSLARNLEQKDKIKFWGKEPFLKTPEIYNQNEIVVNLTNSGSFDKIILEAMACEKPVLICNKSFLDILPDDLSRVLFFEEGSAVDLKNKLKNFLGEPREMVIGERLREIVLKNHSLNFLSQRLRESLVSNKF